jgi:hypothetical protein
MIAERLDYARKEVRQKTKAQIDTETAATWGARAVACYEIYKGSGSLDWFRLSVEFAHEAIEHAAGGVPGTLDRVQAELAASGVPY